ncbi:MAG: hypothetical protein RL213_861 [Bacteroidota bacterium]|jgi:nucleotide-binding universal stress UspA family protein
MIKGKSPFPFERIALAVAFSPRLEGLVAETRRLQRLHKAEVVFIHVGKKTSEKQRLLSALLNRFGFSDANSRVIWEHGTPSEVIPRICKSEIVDLVVLGALQKDDELAGFMGTLSKEISRKAKCAVLLLTAPSVLERPFRKVAVNGHSHRKTPFTLETVAYLADLEDTEEVWVYSLEDPAELSEVEATANRLEDSLGSFGRPAAFRQYSVGSASMPLQREGRKVYKHVLSDRSGSAVREFARQREMDLLVVNSPDHMLSIFDRILPQDIEVLLADLPCNLLIVHSRFNDHSFASVS